MDALLVKAQGSGIQKIQSSARFVQKQAINAEIIKSIELKSDKKEKSEELVESLYFTAQEVIGKLNDILKIELPNGVESLNPDDYTPEKTAENIVSQLSALFEVYSKQNKDKSSEELVDSFMKAARKGVEQGYGEAFDILEGIGAFDINGVKDGVEKTYTLINEKLNKLEESLMSRTQNNKSEITSYSPTAEGLVKQADASNINIIA